MRDIAGRTALVTGASRGIGRAVAIALAKAGADVVVNYRQSEDEANKVCAKIKDMGCRSLAVRADVSLSRDVDSLVETVVRRFGSVSILVNNAGIANVKTPEDITEKDWAEHISWNLTSAFLVTQAVLPHMRAAGWGRIINISSVAAHIGGVVGPHYAASKAGILGLTHYYASYLAAAGITVNTVAPGAVRTDMSAEIPHLRPDLIPVGRFGAPEEIAEAVMLLVHNGYITGQTINVNGGRYMS